MNFLDRYPRHSQRLQEDQADSDPDRNRMSGRVESRYSSCLGSCNSAVVARQILTHSYALTSVANRFSETTARLERMNFKSFSLFSPWGFFQPYNCIARLWIAQFHITRHGRHRGSMPKARSRLRRWPLVSLHAWGPGCPVSWPRARQWQACPHSRYYC